jgi:hypothetical protein
LGGVASIALRIVVTSDYSGVYDMFQEYKLDAETEIDLANKSCEEMEIEIARQPLFLLDLGV